MKRVARSGLIIVAAASGAVAVTMPAFADSAADGGTAHSPGVISGNTVQLPVDVPVNACGNTVNVVGLLNPAAGNSCANKGGDGKGGGHDGSAGAVAEGAEKDSPGLISGNGVHLPVQLPVNVTGNSVSVVGIGNPAVGNESTNTSGEGPQLPETPSGSKPAQPAEPPVDPADPADPADPVEAEGPQILPQAVPRAALAQTGTDLLGPTAAASAALLLGGVALHRRFRPAAQRTGRRDGH
ncbi:chaplin [Streptomyces sp. NPDC127119]|uniref:chaplin n=1 Tax=Streptomyces sp. NPDC127119 TaxID=3345370 RepID=UPI003627DA4B